MDQQSALARPSVFKRLWFRILGTIFLLGVVMGGVAWWWESQRVTATALFQVSHSVPSYTGPNNERALGEYEFEILRRTQLALLQSDFVLAAAIRNPNVGSLSILQRHGDPVKWLQGKLVVNYPENGCLLSISLTGNESEKEDLAPLIDAIALAYRNEVIDEERQQRLVFRDMLSRNIDNLNGEYKRKLDEYLDIARESGRIEGTSGDILRSVAQKRVDRIDDELMRLENQLAIDAKDTPKKASLIEQRLSQLRKNRDEQWAQLHREVERSTDLETRKRDLDQLQSIATEMSTRLEWLDLDASAPDRIRQVQPAVISPQAVSSRLVPTARSVVSSQ